MVHKFGKQLTNLAKLSRVFGRFKVCGEIQWQIFVERCVPASLCLTKKSGKINPLMGLTSFQFMFFLPNLWTVWRENY